MVPKSKYIYERVFIEKKKPCSHSVFHLLHCHNLSPILFFPSKTSGRKYGKENHNKISQTTSQIHFFPFVVFSLKCNFGRTKIYVKGQIFGPVSYPSNS